jgi:hypothetical protein
MPDDMTKRIARFIEPFRVSPGSSVKPAKDFDPFFNAGSEERSGGRPQALGIAGVGLDDGDVGSRAAQLLGEDRDRRLCRSEAPVAPLSAAAG